MADHAEIAHVHCPVADDLAACELCPDAATAARFCHAPAPVYCARCWPCDCCQRCHALPCTSPAACFGECTCADEIGGGTEGTAL